MAQVGAKESKEKKWKDKEEKKKKKKEKQINESKKKVWRPCLNYGYLPDQVCNRIKHVWSTHSFYVQKCGISKIWRAAPRGCSSAPQSPWLVLAPQEINTTRELREHIRIPSSKHDTVVLESNDSDLGFRLYECRYNGLFGTFDKKGCALVGPNSSSDEQFRFTSAIAFGGKLYALSLQGTLAVIDIEDLQQLRATISIPPGVKRAIPSTCSSKGFREYLVALNGEVVVVLLVFRKSMNVVDEVEVLRLDLTIKCGWVKIQSLGDRIMFVGRNYCTHFSASDLIDTDYAKNSIYFNLETGARWWVCDVRAGSISPAQV